MTEKRTDKKTDSQKSYTITSNEAKEHSTVEIKGEIPFSVLNGFRDLVLTGYKSTVEIDGFRKGKVPEDMVIKHVGEDIILEKMAEEALQAVYPAILAGEKIDAIGQPEIVMTKLEKDNPLEFKIITAIVPEVELPDYKAIAKKAMAEKVEVEVTDADFTTSMEQFQRMLQSQNSPEVNPSIKASTELSRTSSGQEKKDDKKKGEDNPSASSGQEKDEPLPELTDKFVKKMGDFTDVADFKVKLRESLVKEKELQGKESKRLAIAEGLIKDAKVEIPKILIKSEQGKMFGQFKDRLTQSGMELQMYLDQTKKTEEEIRDEMEPESIRRVTFNLALAEIAMKENVTADKDAIEKEVENILAHHKDAQREHVQMYVEDILLNEAVFKFLEEVK